MICDGQHTRKQDLSHWETSTLQTSNSIRALEKMLCDLLRNKHIYETQRAVRFLGKFSGHSLKLPFLQTELTGRFLNNMKWNFKTNIENAIVLVVT